MDIAVGPPSPRRPVRAAVAVLAALAVMTVGGACRRSEPIDASSVVTAPPRSAGSVGPGVTSGSLGTGVTAGSAGSGTTAAPVPPTVAVAPAVEPRGRKVDGTLRTDDGRDRTYHVYLPSGLPSGVPVPLLLAFHGGTGWGTQYEQNSGFDGLAEANRFIVVYPDGVSVGSRLMPNGRVWNGGDCCGAAVAQGVDDVAFVRQLLSRLGQDYAIDPARVFAAGHSNGGIMSYRLACELADRIAAIGLQAGWVAIDSCRPSRPVAALHIHGDADQNAPFDGGRGEKSIQASPARAALDSTAMLAAGDGCGGPPSATTAGDLTTYRYPGCPAGVDVELVKVRGAGHAWMGHEPASRAAELLVGTPYRDLDSSAVIWSFLAAHPRS